MKWRVPRTKSNQQILAEFDALRDLNWRGTVFIVDDNFIGNKRNVRQLLPELAEWQKKHGYHQRALESMERTNQVIEPQQYKCAEWFRRAVC